jgi:hypothetical protein
MIHQHLVVLNNIAGQATLMPPDSAILAYLSHAERGAI